MEEETEENGPRKLLGHLLQSGGQKVAASSRCGWLSGY
jgi:hypothetical protein